MDAETRENFAHIVALAQDIFDEVEYLADFTPERAILRLQARYGVYDVFVTELISEGRRKYRYYILREEWVEAGFDNAPDPRAIRQKYGKIGTEHAGENIPHLHLKDKALLSLTEEMTFEGFVNWIKTNI